MSDANDRFLGDTTSRWRGHEGLFRVELGWRTRRLSPRARIGTSLAVLGGAHFFSRRFEEAVPKLLLAIQEDPSFPQSYRYLAACYAHMGRLDDAREVVDQLRAITAVVIPDAGYLRNTEHRELFLSGLRLATGEGA